MEKSLDRLYELLPMIYRMRDAERGEPLQALLQVIAEQVNVVEADIDQLYENWFIETCQDWVVPYIGDLIGYRPVYEAGVPGGIRTEEERLRNRILIGRREIANTLRYRRRKGSLALLELLAEDVAGWPARAVEFFKLLAVCPALDHLHYDREPPLGKLPLSYLYQLRGRTVDLRDGHVLALLNSPFERTAHNGEVRRIASHRTQGRYNIPSVGVFVWRLRAYSVSKSDVAKGRTVSPTPARCIEEVGPQYYTFSALGHDTPLFTRPQREADPNSLAGPLNVPAPIQRHAFATSLQDAEKRQGPSDYYDPERSLAIWVKNGDDQSEEHLIPAENILPANLSGWGYDPPLGKVAVDPELGRIVFPSEQLLEQVRVMYHYGFSADMGGGEYPRVLLDVPRAGVWHYAVGEGRTYAKIQEAIKQWEIDKPTDAVIEIEDSHVYTEPLRLTIGKGKSLQLRAADGRRPILRLLDWQTEGPDSFLVKGEAKSRFTLDGLLIAGRGLRVTGEMTELHIRHCTLVPGWALHCDCEPRRPSEPSLELVNLRARVRIEKSILGAILVQQGRKETEPIPLSLEDSILDAMDAEREAVRGPKASPIALTRMTILRTTVFGKVQCHAIELAENSLFTGMMMVARRQVGCMRFCYVPPDSCTPRRYACQPDLSERDALQHLATNVSEADKTLLRTAAQLRVVPQFTSQRYGNPAYAQLHSRCATEIKRGADDESEMGAFHNLFQPQRAATLQARLDEFTPAGMQAGILYAS